MPYIRNYFAEKGVGLIFAVDNVKKKKAKQNSLCEKQNMVCMKLK
jgi:hypothetical protein